MANDMTILYGILIFFTLIGFINPFINSEFGSEYSGNNLENTYDDDISSVRVSSGAFGIFVSLADVYFWGFGTLPTWLNVVVFIPLRILALLIVARNIWIGGGS